MPFGGSDRPTEPRRAIDQVTTSRGPLPPLPESNSAAASVAETPRRASVTVRRPAARWALRKAVRSQSYQRACRPVTWADARVVPPAPVAGRWFHERWPADHVPVAAATPTRTPAGALAVSLPNSRRWAE